MNRRAVAGAAQSAVDEIGVRSARKNETAMAIVLAHAGADGISQLIVEPSIKHHVARIGRRYAQARLCTPDPWLCTVLLIKQDSGETN